MCLLLNRLPQMRKILLAQDANGMTFFHHAVNTKRDFTDDLTTEATPRSTEDGAERIPRIVPSRTAEASANTIRGAGNPLDRQALVADSEGTTLDPWVPVIRSVLEFARRSLWLPEARNNMYFTVIGAGCVLAQYPCHCNALAPYSTGTCHGSWSQSGCIDSFWVLAWTFIECPVGHILLARPLAGRFPHVICSTNFTTNTGTHRLW